MQEIPNFEDHHHDHAEPRTPFLQFFLITLAEIGVALGLFYLIAPGMFRYEATMPLAILGWILILGLPMSLFEYFYHRYILHSSILPFMKSQHKSHSTHHGLTNVKAAVSPKEPEKLAEVDSNYPIIEEHQEESMMFPWYALPIFYVIFVGVLGIPFKLMFPAAPIIMSTIIATTIYLVGYEMWHAILHFPYEKFWRPLMESRKVGKTVRHVYSFHLMHHWRPTTNLAVVGYWGIALWDHVFRTHKRPQMIPLDKGQVRYLDCEISKPRWPINVIDGWEKGMYKFSRNVEKGVARLVGIKPKA